MCEMESFKKHYQSLLSPEEFFDVVYEEVLVPTTQGPCLQLDAIRKKFDTYSPSKKADVSYALKDLSEKFKHLDLHTNYFNKKKMKEESHRLDALVQDHATILKDLLEKNAMLTKEVEDLKQEMKRDRYKMDAIVFDLQETTQESIKKIMSHEFRIQCLADCFYDCDDSKT